MPDFPFSPEGYTAGRGWRPLRLIQPLQRGWDVYDLQCKLAYLGYSLDVDGWFGPKTEAIVRNFQSHVFPLAGPVDGIAGVKTQVTLGTEVALAGALPQRVRGQLEKESSLLCGIYTAPYTDGSIDRGPTQQNSRYWLDAAHSFDVRQCIPDLVFRIKTNADRYKSWGVSSDRAWAAAQGHWNSPVNADRYAKGLSVPAAFQDYIDAVTAYVGRG